MKLEIRPATAADAARIAEVHSQGIEERVATFRTAAREPGEVELQLADGRPAVVAEGDGAVVGWAWASPYDDAAPYYATIREATVFVDRSARGAGVGRLLLTALEDAATTAGAHKLVAKIFDTNRRSIRLFESCGWRSVGTHARHGLLEDEWKDVVVLEKLLGEAAR